MKPKPARLAEIRTTALRLRASLNGPKRLTPAHLDRELERVLRLASRSSHQTT